MDQFCNLRRTLATNHLQKSILLKILHCQQFVTSVKIFHTSGHFMCKTAKDTLPFSTTNRKEDKFGQFTKRLQLKQWFHGKMLFYFR